MTTTRDQTAEQDEAMEFAARIGEQLEDWAKARGVEAAYDMGIFVISTALTTVLIDGNDGDECVARSELTHVMQAVLSMIQLHYHDEGEEAETLGESGGTMQ